MIAYFNSTGKDGMSIARAISKSKEKKTHRHSINSADINRSLLVANS